MKKSAVIINVVVNGEAYIVSYESGVVRTYKAPTKPITEWLEAHQELEVEEEETTLPIDEPTKEEVETEETPADEAPAEIALVEEPEETVINGSEVTDLVPVAPAEVATIETEAEAEVEVLDETTELVEVVSDQDPAEAPGFGWRDALEIAKATIRAIVVACKASAPVAKAACTTLWHVACLVAMAMVSLVKTIRLYGPDVIAEVVTDAKVAYYKAKALYFRTKRYGRIAIKGVRETAKLARGAVSTSLEATVVGFHHLAGVAVLAALMVAKMASVAIAMAMTMVHMTAKVASAAAGCAKSGWDLREQIIRENEEA